ncbi:methyltransferase family protein [Humitalea rosea]|uniref:Methyltransferase family protein n=1 Tax=Humitalea rosea TaxID=990373 RepID=A0A2W7ITG6_9PROT|nr:class I SAM-dependent methyltransferase [Humitalea rosea]PZW50804.1 methyltransferase family protein [Humitalea rosea]
MPLGLRLLPPSAGDRFRRARFGLCRGIIEDVVAQRGACHVLDIGGALRYWQVCAPDLLEDARVSFDMVNIAYSPGDQESAEAIGGNRIRLLLGDARAMPEIADGAYDLAHSNSVIEHVGRWPDMQAMAAEVRRIGQQYYVQTPYWGFPIEPHFRVAGFHWLPEQWRLSLVMRAARGYHPQAETVDAGMRMIESAVLLNRRQYGALFPGANIHSEIVYGLTKSLIALGGTGVAPDPQSNTRALRV